MLSTKSLISIRCHIFDPFCPFCFPLTTFPSGTHHCIVCMHEFGFCFGLLISLLLFVLYSTDEWNHMVLSFSIWLISLSIIPWTSPILSQMAIFHFFMAEYYSFKNYFLFFIFIQLQLSAFSPHPSTPSQPIPPPFPTSTLPLDFVFVSFIVAPIDPSPHYSLPTPLWLLLHFS